VSIRGPVPLLFAFHRRAGARVALRVNGVLAAAIVFIYALDIDVIAHLRLAILQLVSRGAGWTSRMQFAAICVALAAAGMPRVTLGSPSWLRSLPLSSATARRAAILALCTVQVFTIAVAVLATLGAVVVYGKPLESSRILGLVLMIFAAAELVLPVQHVIGPLLAAGALGLGVSGRWSSDAAAIVLLIIADHTSGAVVPFRPRRTRRAWRVGGDSSPVAQWIRLTLRALPFATLAACAIAPSLFAAFAAVIVVHNPDMDAVTAARTIAIGGTLAMIALAAGLSSSLVSRRTAWPWLRSLPWSSRQRVTGDTLLLAAALLVIPICLAFVDWRSGIRLALVAAPLAAASSAAIRSGARRHTSAAGEIAIAGVTFGAAIALWPWSAGLIIATMPLLFTYAVRRDQSLLITRWEELHHDASGDPAWVSTA
jgi:hypothetical protein